MQDSGGPVSVSRADRHDSADALLPQVACGSESAMAACIDRYGPLLWGLARKQCPTTADAEDAVQEIFLALWRYAGRFEPARGSELTFVATIARRRLIDRHRQRQRQPRPVGLPESEPPSTSTSDASDAIADAEDVARARCELAKLPEGQQRVLTLILNEGLSHSEVAEVTGLPLGTVKTNARRGLITLRNRLRAGAANDEVAQS